MDSRLAGDPDRADEVPLSSPWDAWWACYRMALPLGQIGVGVAVPHSACPTCEWDALKLAAAAPPGHPGLGQPRSCRCLLEWAVRMRSPAGQVSWPPVSLSLALLKPGAPWDWVGRQLASAHQVLLSFQRTLTTMDTRRLYPEAYGATYLAARDAYLTRAPVLVLVLRALAPGSETSGQVKTSIRHELGGDVLCNHLRMPDNPGEALADIAHFAGERTLAELHGRYERDGTAGRLAFYRAALGIGQAGAHRDRAARRGMCTAAR